MKFAIPSDTRDRNGKISESFGRAKYFLLIEVGTDAEEIVINPYVNAMESSGIQLANLLIEKNVTNIVVRNMGMKAFRVLCKADIAVEVTDAVTIQEVILTNIQKKNNY